MYFSRLQGYRIVPSVIEHRHKLRVRWIPGQARNDGVLRVGMFEVVADVLQWASGVLESSQA
jgi:hypothetical protein